MKYHGFFLLCAVILVAIAVVAYWLEFWKWNCEMADRKMKGIKG